MNREKSDPQDVSALRSALSALRKQQDALFAELGRGQRRFQALARSAWQVSEDERRRLARDLHDGLGQNLTALQHLLEQAQAAAHGPPRGLIERALSTVRLTLEEVRGIAQALRPRVLDDLGMTAALSWLARTMGAAGRFHVHLDVVDPMPQLSDPLATLVFRVAQEALTNAARHARCQNVLLRLSADGGWLTLLIADDGLGFDPKAAGPASADAFSGGGLAGMRERLALFGGSLDVVSSPGAGTRIRAQLALETTEPE